MIELQRLQQGLDPKGDRGRPPSPPPPPTKHKAYPNGSYRFTRYDSITPHPKEAERDFEGLRVWHISSKQPMQVEAVTVKTSQRVQLLGISVGKEAKSEVPEKFIEYLAIVRGSQTQGQVLWQGHANVNYTDRNPQYEKLMIDGNIILDSNPVTIKIKYKGKGLYFGEPNARILPSKGLDGTEFTFESPRFMSPDQANGDCRLGGPFVRFYYRPV